MRRKTTPHSLVHVAERCIQLAALGILCIGTALAQDDEEKKLGWADEAELALVTTAGNSRTSTFGFRNLLSHTGEGSLFHFEVSGLRTETTTTTRTPVGESPEDFVIEKESTSVLTAENYVARAKYDRNLSDRFFLYGSGGWDRNEFAGIRNRYFGAGGVGNIWYERDDLKWRTDYGISVTREEGTIASPDTFAGIRLSSNLTWAATGNTTLTNLTIANENLNDTSDLRIDSLTALSVSMTDRLAVRVSLQFLFDNLPSFVAAPLEFPRGLPLDILVPVQAEKLDTLFNVALVLTF